MAEQVGRWRFARPLAGAAVALLAAAVLLYRRDTTCAVAEPPGHAGPGRRASPEVLAPAPP